jgi:outer membrane protein TolC
MFVLTGETNVPVRQISLQDCIQMALEQNFILQIERYNPQLSLYTLGSARGAYDPTFDISAQHSYEQRGGTGFDPNTGLPRPGSESEADSIIAGMGGLLPWGMTYDLNGNMTDSYGSSSGASFETTRGQAGLTLSQPLLRNLWIDVSRLNVYVAKNRVKFSEFGLRDRMIFIISRVEEAYYDLIAAEENVKVREAALELAQRLLAENKKRVEVGALAPLDEKQAEAEAAIARANLIQARQILASQQNTLKSLITDEYQVIHDVYFDPAEALTAPLQIFNLQESWMRGIAERPDLHQVKLDLERQGIQLKYNRNQLFPQLDVFGSYGYNAGGPTTIEFSDGFGDLRERDMPFYSYGARFSIPLSNRRARYDYKSVKASVQQALLRVKELEQQILVAIDNSVIIARANYDRVDATRAAREYAEAALQAEQKKLESGKSTSFFVLQLQRNLTEARSQEIDALAAYNKALTTLAEAEGTTLERRGVDVQMR